MKIKKRSIILSIIFLLTFSISLPQIFHKNSGTSQSKGQVHKGSLINAYKIPYKGENYKYFSSFSYFILGRGYLHSKAFNTVIDTYKEFENLAPGQKFKIMECSKQKGGKLFPHRTHQNGLSVDFMTPLVKGKNQKRLYDNIGIFRYGINFNNSGVLKINKKVEIDFDTMARHILILDDMARRNGLSIKKVIFKIELKQELFNTVYGHKLKNRGIYFAQHLPEKINNLHDDHYHIDFEILK